MTISIDDTRTQEFRLKLFPILFEESKQFYSATLGYPIRDEWDRGEANRGVMFDTGSGIIELLGPARPEVIGCNVSLEVTDVWTLWEKLKDHPAIAYALKDNSWGDSSFGIKDPNGFELTYFTRHSLENS